MATDGVKIIDGNIAFDTYWGIMDLYDSQAEFSIIEKEFPLTQRDYFDDFDNEIYVTSCALAFWEIGLVTMDRLAVIKEIIDKGACVKLWMAESDNMGQSRQKELDKFWKKISQANQKIRPRKKFRKITNFYFQIDDLLTFKLKDGNYRAVICADIEQYRGQCNYIFVPTTFTSPLKPNVTAIAEKEILGRRIGTGYDQGTTRAMQPGIERVWNFEFEGGNSNYLFGVDKLAINHKDMIKLKAEFEKIGTLKIINGLKKTGSYGCGQNMEDFDRIFDDLDNYIKIFGFKKFPVQVLCDI